MPMLAIDMSDPAVVLRPLEPPIRPRVVVIMTRPDEHRSAAADRFVELALQESRRMLSGCESHPGQSEASGLDVQGSTGSEYSRG